MTNLEIVHDLLSNLVNPGDQALFEIPYASSGSKMSGMLLRSTISIAAKRSGAVLTTSEVNPGSYCVTLLDGTMKPLESRRTRGEMGNSVKSKLRELLEPIQVNELIVVAEITQFNGKKATSNAIHGAVSKLNSYESKKYSVRTLPNGATAIVRVQ